MRERILRGANKSNALLNGWLSVECEERGCEEGMAQTCWRETFITVIATCFGPSGSDFSAVFDQFLRMIGMNALCLVINPAYLVETRPNPNAKMALANPSTPPSAKFKSASNVTWQRRCGIDCLPIHIIHDDRRQQQPSFEEAAALSVGIATSGGSPPMRDGGIGQLLQ